MANATEWRVPRMWEGQQAVVLASGPSMSQSVADMVRYVPALRVIAVNNTFRLAPWADMLYACDERWWAVNSKEALAFHGLKVSCEDARFKEVLMLKNTGSQGFDPDPGNIRTGGNSGYQAVHIAAHAGVRRILLCGFDMKGGHWHPEHKTPLREPSDACFMRWVRAFVDLADELKRRGIEVWNCTPDSALECFPSVALDDALERVSQAKAA